MPPFSIYLFCHAFDDFVLAPPHTQHRRGAFFLYVVKVRV
jgi:hypothetical protein